MEKRASVLFSWLVLQSQPLKCEIEIKSSHYQYLEVQQISMQHLWTVHKYLRSCLWIPSISLLLNKGQMVSQYSPKGEYAIKCLYLRSNSSWQIMVIDPFSLCRCSSWCIFLWFCCGVEVRLLCFNTFEYHTI